MFKKLIMFEIRKMDTVKVIDTLSKYKTGLIYAISDLSIVDAGLADRQIYTVSLHCKAKELEKCLNDILKLNRRGVVITGLVVA